MNKKRFMAFVACAFALVAAFALVGCGGTSAQTAGSAAGSASAGSDDSADIKTLTVGFDQSYPPYGFVGDDGEFTGFDIELATEVAKRCGWELKLEPIDWDAKDSLLNSGAINCIWNGFTMEGREDDYTFSDPYMLNGQVIVVKKDSGIKSLDDLAGKTVAVQSGSTGPKIVADVAPDATLQEFKTDEEARKALEQGRVDAYVIDTTMQMGTMVRNPNKYRLAGDPFGPEDKYGIGLPKDSDGVQFVNDFLQKIEDDGTWANLWKICIGDRADIADAPNPPALEA